MPKIAQPQFVAPKRAEVAPRQPERIIGTINASTKTEINGPDLTPTPKENSGGVRIGTKLSIRYLNGPRAGVVAKLWFQKTTSDPKFEVNDFRSVGPGSPLGQALEGAQTGEILSFDLKNEEIRVQVIELKHP